MESKIINGNNIDVLKTYPDDYFDSVVTDPPYLIDFLGKDWDKHMDQTELWEECLRVLKPGGHLVAFSAARTYHKIAMFIDVAGFEIRDQLFWCYSSGFPKAQSIGKQIDRRAGNKTELGKQWAGFKSALKPAHEPLVLARKPFKGSCIDNVLKHGTGAMNIDACRIDLPIDDKLNNGITKKDNHKLDTQNMGWGFKSVDREAGIGRYPSNVIGEIPEKQESFFNPEYDKNYMYQPKVNRKERHIGFDTIPHNGNSVVGGMYGEKQSVARVNTSTEGNNHPTVKPVALMSWLVKLITPPGGKVLDPFNGSGSTGMACIEHGFDYTGLELDPEYCEISKKRIKAWDKHCKDKEAKEVKEGLADNNYDDLFGGK